MRSAKLKLLIAYLLLLGAIFFLGSCSQSKKLQKAKSTMLNNPAELAKLCSEQFPPKETTIYLPGETVYDTLYSLQEVVIPVDCPPSDTGVIIQWKVKTEFVTVEKTRTDTISKVTVDRAREYALNAELASLRADIEKAKDKLAKVKKTRNWLIISLIALLILLGVWAYFRIRTAGLRAIIR